MGKQRVNTKIKTKATEKKPTNDVLQNNSIIGNCLKPSNMISHQKQQNLHKTNSSVVEAIRSHKGEPTTLEKTKSEIMNKY
jgi:hypothetical protein